MLPHPGGVRLRGEAQPGEHAGAGLHPGRHHQGVERDERAVREADARDAVPGDLERHHLPLRHAHAAGGEPGGVVRGRRRGVGEERDVAAEPAEQEGLVHRHGAAGEDADAAVADLPAVAVGAVEDVAAPPLADAGDVRQPVGEPARHQQAARAGGAAVVEGDDEAGVAVPKTWAEYAAAAEAIKAKTPDHYITYLDPSLVDAAYMGLWQLSAEPWSIADGTNVTLNLQSEKAKQWADYWTDLNAKGLTIESVQGSDEWFKQLGAGQIATWVVGAWGLQALTGVLPDNKGLWRVAPQPVWNEGDVGTSQFGGSVTVGLAQSAKKEAAVEFALWMNGSPEGVATLKDDQGLLPTTKAAWEDPAFIDEEIEYLGGQQARQIFAESAKNSVVGWTWLPFQPYVSSVYRDTVGQAISGKTSVFDGFKAWQDRIAQYAGEQGFTVSTK